MARPSFEPHWAFFGLPVDAYPPARYRLVPMEGDALRDCVEVKEAREYDDDGEFFARGLACPEIFGRPEPTARRPCERDRRFGRISLRRPVGHPLRGQAMRTEELAETLHRVRLLSPRTFTEDDPVGLGALVRTELEDGEARTFFLLDVAGGTELVLAPGEPSVWVVSPSSPVGRALVGRSVGDEVVIARAGAMRHYDIVAIA